LPDEHLFGRGDGEEDYSRLLRNRTINSAANTNQEGVKEELLSGGKITERLRDLRESFIEVLVVPRVKDRCGWI